MSYRTAGPLLAILFWTVTVGPAEARCRRAVTEAAAGHAHPTLADAGGPELGEAPEANPAGTAPAGSGGRSTDEPKSHRNTAPSVPVPILTVVAGETLRAVLDRWSTSAGWHLVWDAAADYSMSAPATFAGGFPEAVSQLMESLKSNGAPFGAELYAGNRVVRIMRVR